MAFLSYLEAAYIVLWYVLPLLFLAVAVLQQVQIYQLKKSARGQAAASAGDVNDLYSKIRTVADSATKAQNSADLANGSVESLFEDFGLLAHKVEVGRVAKALASVSKKRSKK